MDPPAFDRFARACAAGGTRRRLVALLAALPVAELLTNLSGEEAAAAGKLGGEPCDENRDCQTFICLGAPSGQCTCSNRQSIGCATPPSAARRGFSVRDCVFAQHPVVSPVRTGLRVRATNVWMAAAAAWTGRMAFPAGTAPNAARMIAA